MEELWMCCCFPSVVGAERSTGKSNRRVRLRSDICAVILRAGTREQFALLLCAKAWLIFS